MSTVYMANNGDNPLGFYSTYPLAASVSSDVIEMEIPVLEGGSNGCVFYADAVFTLFSMRNGIPEETIVTIGPSISRSANTVLNDMHFEVVRRRLSGCELEHFLCFEIDRFYGEPLVKEPTIYDDPCAPHFTCPGDCKNDPLIKKTWNMLSEGKMWDLEHLSLDQLITELCVLKPRIDLHNRYYSFTTNLVIKSILYMCKNSASVNVLASGGRTNTLERVSIDKVGYIVFVDELAADKVSVEQFFQTSLQNDTIQNWKLSDVFEYFISNQEYGIYFVKSLSDNRYIFVERELILSAYRVYLELRSSETNDDGLELTLSDSARQLLNIPRWWMVWNEFLLS